MRMQFILIGLLSAVALATDLPYYGYKDLLDEIGKWEENPEDDIDIVWADEKYSKQIPTFNECPYRNPITGVESSICKIPIITLRTQEKPIDDQSAIPQILVLAGFDGFDRVGPSSIINYLHMVQSNHNYQNLITGHFRLIFIPILNPRGYYSRQSRLEDNPLDDFSLFRANNKCFSTAGSRVIQMILKENLISTTLIFKGTSSDTLNLSILSYL